MKAIKIKKEYVGEQENTIKDYIITVSAKKTTVQKIKKLACSETPETSNILYNRTYHDTLTDVEKQKSSNRFLMPRVIYSGYLSYMFTPYFFETCEFSIYIEAYEFDNFLSAVQKLLTVAYDNDTYSVDVNINKR